MAQRSINKKMLSLPGIVVECKSGRFIAYYEHRTDIVANALNEKQVKKNLKEMYTSVIKYEEQENEQTPLILPKSFRTRSFKEKHATR